jgi:hypothetical protein
MDELNLMNLLLFLASQNSTGGSGGGGTSVYISNCSIDANGDLIVTLSDGTVMNAGKCKGEDGADGESPTINVYDASPGNYQLEIVNPDGTSYITPNLMGSGTSSTRYTVYKNHYTQVTLTVFTQYLILNLSLFRTILMVETVSVMKNESYSLYYNTTDFGWSGNVTTFNTVPISSTGTNMLLLSYTSGSTKDEKLKFIPTSLVTGSTNLEIAESIKSILTAGSEAIVTLDFDFNYSANNITEAIGLESVPVGDYYIAWTASSDNSQPKISSMIVM